MTKVETVRNLVHDLREEQQLLQNTLAGLSETDWNISTPAEGWNIFDQVAHLAHFDFITRTAVTSLEHFEEIRDRIDDLQTYVDLIGPANMSRKGAETLTWWQHESSRLNEAFLQADPDMRVPWFGPSMGVPSKVTARIMETWAHGQDIRDALGIVQEPTPRLRHVARIGVLTFSHSFKTQGLPLPAESVRVELTMPDGSTWAAGDDSAKQLVAGPIQDFCLVVTQRRHIEDTDLVTQGETSAKWMSIAQAFAGPPGQGRDPGQFHHLSYQGGIEV
jgi:uncharacterized protein (TIGR03084 family)